MCAALLGKPLMEWQQYVADVILEIDPDTGQLAYDEWILGVPRQSGKSTFILAKSTHRASATAFFGARQRVVYTAQSRLKAREKWEEDFVGDLEQAPRFRGKFTVHKGNGNEHIRFANGSRVGIESNTEKAGHGGTLDESYIDEAFAQVDNRLEQAFGPAMITRANKQLGVVSTAGWANGSPYLWGKVAMGRQLVNDDVRTGTAYFEWSAPEDADPGDEAVWLACMPAVHRPECLPGCRAHTITLTAIRAEYAKAKRSGKVSDFRRAYLNQWVTKPRQGEETAVGNWHACQADLETLPPIVAIGVAVSHDRDAASIGGCGVFDDGRRVVAPITRRPETGWLVDEVARIQYQHGCAVVLDEKGPGGYLIEDLERAGVNVTRARLEDYITACADFTDAVRDRRLVHPGDKDLDDAVQGARWRPVGDRRVFGRKASETDVSLLEAVTLAMWGAESGPSIYEGRGLLVL